MEFMRTCMIVINVIILLVGVAVLGIGIWAAADKSFQDTICQDHFNVTGTVKEASIEACNLAGYVVPATILFIIVGSFVLIVGFLGCYGAKTKSKCMLGVYVLILIILLVVLVAAAVYAFVHKDSLISDTEKVLNKLYDGEIKLFMDNGNVASLVTLNIAQDKLDCCGAKGPSDYSNGTETKYPQSCYIKTGSTKTLKESGCTSKVSSWLQGAAKTLGITGIVLAAILLIGTICSLVLCQSM